MTVDRLGGEPPSPYEERYGFSRVVRAGDLIMVGGTTSVDPLGFVIGVTPYEQAVEILAKLTRELARLGARPEDVISTRAYVTDVTRADEVGRAFSECFGEIRPLLTLVGVAALIDPRMLVEIEATAYAPVGPPAA
ncbi:Rid family hydrolase [Conexibacter sp. DBS9H8]|uniref:Rid family hydrolase n=1 Tax=Conexibacter sp. DBS9H8 TaxID=2937801 RepID=UPI00200CEC7F|nr:Rid family hydrolase [Conexibacter sp. DBS9H8]